MYLLSGIPSGRGTEYSFHRQCHLLPVDVYKRQGVNIKVIQDALGHSDISTTLNIYADVTKELRKSEFENLDRQFAQWKDPEE